MPVPSDTRAMPAWDPIWDSIFASQVWGNYPPEAVIRSCLRPFNIAAERPHVCVLDLGCGPGANTWFLAREGFAVSAIDGSAVAVERNRSRLAREGLTADVRIGDFTETLPWKDGTFDLVLDNVSLCANPISAIKRAVAEIKRVLKPNGHLVSLSFTERTWGFGCGHPGPDKDSFVDIPAGPLANKGIIQFFSRERLYDTFAGFHPLSVERVYHTLYNEEKIIELWVYCGVFRD